MKKIISVILAFCFVFLFSVCSFATTIEVFLDDVGMKISLPMTYIFATDDTDLDKLGSDGDNSGLSLMKSFFESGACELYAININTKDSIMVVVVDSDFEDYSSTSYEELLARADDTKSSIENVGGSVYDYGVVESPYTKFIKMESSFNDNAAHPIVYSTSNGGKQISISFTPSSVRNTSEYERIVKSIYFTNGASPSTQKYEYTTQEDIDVIGDEFVYTDSEAGVIFSLNGDWEYTDAKENSETKVAYTYPGVPGTVIQYASKDILAADDKIDESQRYAIDNSYFTEEEWADFLGEDYTVNVLNYKEYYIKDTTVGVPYGMKKYMVVHIEYGWMYVFIFTGEPKSNASGDFQTMLENVIYTRPQSMLEQSTAAADDGFGGDYTEDSGVDFSSIFIMVIIVAAAVAVVIFIRKKKAAEALKAATVETFECIPSAQKTTPDENTLVCKECGATVPEDSRFCHICGKEIKKEKE